MPLIITFVTFIENKIMNVKLLNNLPIEDLTEENDYLGIIVKGDLIKLFLESNKDQFSDIKMFALYGEWGSGKSTLMKYLQKELRPNFNTFFFDTWEFETDNNLSLSLLELLISESTTPGEDVAGELIKVAEKLLKGFTKSIRISLPGLSIDGKALTEELESEKEKTFAQLRKEFKTEFQRWEDKVVAQNKREYNVVFIDDLDRCEPENVLNLLSALKLFFTYGKRTVFFCGIDKKAVNEAVKTKYGEVVKANEYLEKIFDLSFSMPAIFHFDRLVGFYFSDIAIGEKNVNGIWSEQIEDFFKKMNFFNPRRVKKVLNKYKILLNFCAKLESEGYRMPNIYFSSQKEGCFFETIVCLYFVILREFYPEIDKNLFRFDLKKDNYVKAINNTGIIKAIDKSTHINQISGYLDRNYSNRELKSIQFLNQDQDFTLICFAPMEVKQVTYYSISNVQKLTDIIPKSNTIDYLFHRYLVKNFTILSDSNSLSNFSLLDLKEMISRIS
jgi:energy-coupling factor transporter ATP-binding protein EcfA2